MKEEDKHMVDSLKGIDKDKLKEAGSLRMQSVSIGFIYKQLCRRCRGITILNVSKGRIFSENWLCPICKVKYDKMIENEN